MFAALKNHLMRVIPILLLILCSNTLFAQPQKGTFIHASAGLGYVYPTEEEVDVSSSGFYAQAELVWSPLSWVGARPYVGFISSSGDTTLNGEVIGRVKSNAFMIGAKIRIVAPIPYFAPFLEAGFGVSAGSFETKTMLVDVRKNGLTPHVPYSIGVAVGRRHNIEIKLTYYEHYELHQFNGAAAVGFTFPI